MINANQQINVAFSSVKKKSIENVSVLTNRDQYCETMGGGGVTLLTDKTRQCTGKLNPFAGHKFSLTVAHSAYRCHGACEAPGKIAKFNFGRQKLTTSVVPFLSGGILEFLSQGNLPWCCTNTA